MCVALFDESVLLLIPKSWNLLFSFYMTTIMCSYYHERKEKEKKKERNSATSTHTEYQKSANL